MYAHKIFCSWDFNIFNAEAADMKKSNIYTELMALIDALNLKEKKLLRTRFYVVANKCAVHLFVIGILTGFGYLIRNLLIVRLFDIRVLICLLVKMNIFFYHLDNRK